MEAQNVIYSADDLADWIWNDVALPPIHGVPDCFCRKCDTIRFFVYWQKIKGGRKQARCDCAECGSFIKYLPLKGF